MKRFFALVALVLGLASCQTEPEGLDVQMGGAVDATITVNIPDSETRAGGSNSAGSIFDNVNLGTEEDTNTMRYILMIYDAEGQASKDRQVTYSDGKSVNFDVRLVPGRHYSFVVWADYVTSKDDTDNHYNTKDGLTNITLKADTWVAMDETRDAFTGVFNTAEDGNKTPYNGAKDINITLTRPFAKLRVITTDIKELDDLHITPAYATVEYTTEYRPAFDALAGTAKAVGTDKKAHSTVFPIAPYTNEANDEHNRTIFTDYFFANEGDAVSFILNIYEDAAKTKPIKSNNFSTDIAVNRNYLTTISGNILTDGNKINVTVEDRFVDADGNNQYIDYKTISSDKEFLAAVNTPGKYVVISDLHIAHEGDTVTTLATRAGDATTTIDLNGKTITVDNKGTDALASVAAGNTLVITNSVAGGKIELTEGSTGAFIENNGTVVIENGSIESESTNDAPVIDNNGTTNITGGVIGDNAVENTENGDVNITGGTFESDPSEFVDSDYNVVEKEDGSFDVEIKDVIAKIGEVEYRTLQKAVDEAKNGDTITFVADVEQVDGVLITDKNLTIDLNGKTYTITEGANTNYRNFKVNGSSVVTIKNGSIVAQGELTSGAYGTVRTEGTAVVNLESVKLYSYRGYGLNVKARAGTTIKIKDSEIYAQYSGGVEAEGGNIELTNVKIDQTGVYSDGAWCSVAIGVNGGGEVTVNSGNYSASAISTDANAAQGTWVAYVMSSGGTLNIKGGTFNGVVAETASAANACGLICADTKAIVNIYGGTFLSNGAILDMRNNTGGTPNPSATLYAGTFSADPRISGLYASNLITVAEGCKVTDENGVWTVSLPEALAKFLADIAKGGEVTLDADITLYEPVVIESGKTVVLNLNGKTITGNWHKDNGAVIKNNGTLTIVGGTISSTGENGGSAIQNTGKLTIKAATLNGAPNANGSWPSYAVNNTGTMTAENTTITSYHGAVASYNDGAVVTLNNCTIDMAGIPGFTNHGIYTYNNGKVVVNGGTYENKATDQSSTGASVINGAVEVNAGTFSGRIENYYGTPVLKGGTFSVKPNANFIAAGYKAIEKDGKYIVVTNDVDAVASTPAEVLSAMKVAGQTVYIVPTADGSAHKLDGKMSLAEGVKLIGMGDTPVALFNDWGSNAFANQAHFTNTHVENINFTNNLIIDAGIANGDVKFVNCVFGGDLAHQGVHFDSGNGTITFENCTFVGRNMFGSSLEKVIFNNCTFLNKKSSQTAADLWTGVNMWGEYEFNNCTFDTEAHCNVKCDGVTAAFNNCKYVDNRDIETIINNSQNFNATITIE